MDKVRDWEGLEVVGEEDPNDVILVWEIDPYMANNSFDVAIVREYQRALSFVEDHLEMWLENYTQEELRDGVNLKMRLIPMTLEDYRDIDGQIDD
jgi:hypothetical protein